MTKAGRQNSPELNTALADVRACRECAAQLPQGPRPVVQLGTAARLLIVGQAPGNRVHQTGIPFNDPSGDRLRDWLGVDRDCFYDPAKIALLPMGFCFPGTSEKGGDLPPRKECGPLWHPRLRTLLESVELTLLVGQYAQAFYLGKARQKNLTETVRVWRDYLPNFLPTPHPSWRVNGWLKRNPWFDEEVVPYLQAEVRRLTAD